MTPEHDEQLCREFPILYRDRHRSMRETCMAWGFTCGDGWFQIIYDLSKKLEAYIQELPFAGDGSETCFMPVASQVKEKFGTLRFYLANSDQTMEKMISDANHLSSITCEECGSPGSLRNDGWLHTLCDSCAVLKEKK